MYRYIWTKFKETWQTMCSKALHHEVWRYLLYRLFSFCIFLLPSFVSSVTEYQELGQLSVYCLSAPNLPFIACSATMLDPLVNTFPLPAGTMFTFVRRTLWRGTGRGSWSSSFCCASFCKLLQDAPSSCSRQLTSYDIPLGGSPLSTESYWYSTSPWMASQQVLGHGTSPWILPWHLRVHSQVLLMWHFSTDGLWLCPNKSGSQPGGKGAF